MNRTPDSILIENQAHGTDLNMKCDEPLLLVQDLTGYVFKTIQVIQLK